MMPRIAVDPPSRHRFHQRFGRQLVHRYGAVGWLVLYELLAAGMFRGVIVDRVLTFQVGGDSSLQIYAWLMKVWQAAPPGRLVLWGFGIYAGTSFVGGLEPGPLYPPAILVLPPPTDH